MSETELGILASMATPAVLLLANAMLILSTINRLRVILDRVRETELTIAGADVVPESSDFELLDELLVAHAMRARHAHRALLAFYTSASLFMAAIVALGIGGLGIPGGTKVALAAAFLGCGLLFAGATLLIRETWAGIQATDRRFADIRGKCRQLATYRPNPPAG